MFQFLPEFLPADDRTGIELFLPFANKWPVPDPSDDPLRYVTIQMQHEVANAVGRFVRSPPNLFICQLFRCGADAREEFAAQKFGGMLDEFFTAVQFDPQGLKRTMYV